MKNLPFIIFLVLGITACPSGPNTENSDTKSTSTKRLHVGTTIDVNKAHFTAANSNTKITTVDCTLSDGTKTKCYQIVSNSTPTDHPMGPWCPDNITDDASAGGIWLEGGKVYDVDGEFIKNMATFYKDKTWKMFDATGKVFVTETEQDCINAANPNVGEEYQNFCVECLPSYITDVSQTWLIPITPVLQDAPTLYKGPGGPGGGGPGGRPPKGEKGERPKGPKGHGGRPPRGKKGGIPSTRGIALNGVEFSAPAPVNNILSAYTLAPFDDAGGHINVHQGYHYHAATGVSFSVKQSDGHAPLIGYAMDGHGLYAQLDAAGKEASDLDDCRGHSDEVRGYHYHVDAAGMNNFINCFSGAIAE